MRALDVGVIILLCFVPLRQRQDRVIGFHLPHIPLCFGDVAVCDEGLVLQKLTVAGVPFAVREGVIVVVLDVVAPFHDGDELFVVVHIRVGPVGLLFKEPLAECPEIAVEVALGVHGKAVLVLLVSCAVAVHIDIRTLAQLIERILRPLAGAYRIVNVRQIVGLGEIFVVKEALRLGDTGHIVVAHGKHRFAAIGEVGQVARRPPRLCEIDIRQIADRQEDVVRDRHAHQDHVGENGGIVVRACLNRCLCRVHNILGAGRGGKDHLRVEAILHTSVSGVKRVIQRIARHLLPKVETVHSLIAEHRVGGTAEILFRQSVRVVKPRRFRFAVRIGRGAAIFRFRAETAGLRGISAVSAGREREEHGDEQKECGELLGSLFHLDCLSVSDLVNYVQY